MPREFTWHQTTLLEPIEEIRGASEINYIIVNPIEFDEIVSAYYTRDEHDFLESRFFDANGQVIAKVVRHLDENEELIPEADLMIAADLGSR